MHATCTLLICTLLAYAVHVKHAGSMPLLIATSTAFRILIIIMQNLVAERDKTFRAQAFALKQLNTRVVQLQHQQTDQASREAALREELSSGTIEGQPSSVASLVAGSEYGVTLRRIQSKLPPGMETMRRRLEPIMSTGETCSVALSDPVTKGLCGYDLSCSASKLAVRVIRHAMYEECHVHIVADQYKS